jgi:hypothetical protein
MGDVTMRLVSCLTLLCLPLTILGQEPASKEGAYAQQIAELGNDNFRVREQAHQQLRDAGPAAQAALENASETSPDAEVRQRAEVLLRRLTAGPRIKGAIAQLASDKWDEVKEGLNTLCDEMGEGTGAEEAVRKISDGKGQSAQIARTLRQQWENWDRQQQQFVRNVSFQGAQFMQQYFTSFRQNMKRSIEFMCKREFDQLHAKDNKEKKAVGEQ